MHKQCKKCGEIFQSEELPVNRCHYYNDLNSDPPSTEDVANGIVGPECYICGEEIKEGDKYYNLKIFVCGCPVEVNLCKDCMEDCEEEN